MMGFPVQNEGTTSFHLEALMLKCKQSVHSREAFLRKYGEMPVWERVNLLLIVAFGSLKLVIKVKKTAQ